MAEKRYNCDLLVVGAGPAGLAAAHSAAGSGRRVTVIDDNPAAGGQIWRGGKEAARDGVAGEWFERIGSVEIEFIQGARIVDRPEASLLVAETDEDLLELSYERLVLATGARERFIPFPGWTLPGVAGAGGLQALVKSGLPIAGKRIVVAGSGPLLLAVADYLNIKGAEVLLIAEQASLPSLARFGLGLVFQPSKIMQAAALQRRLAGIPYLKSCWPVAAHGDGRLERVTLRQGNRAPEVACDYLACGFHLVPNTELPAMLGCRIGDGAVEVDDLQRTSVPGIYCAGEATGIGGLELSLAEGTIAGLAAAGDETGARGYFAARARHRRFARRLNRAFALREELKSLPDDFTVVCRCEDVTFARLKKHPGWRDAKLQTRCGMGPCQGRICGQATEFLLGWGADSVRPPVFAARIESLANLMNEKDRYL